MVAASRESSNTVLGLIQTPANVAAAMIADGTLTSESLVSAYLERITQREDAVFAFAHFDPEYALTQARARDKAAPLSPLHGIPIAIKDTIDTEDFPTEFNSPIYAGSKPTRDAACVAMVRQAGAVVLGKTRTVEFAAGGQNPATRNPHNPVHGPGGSSNGSAASVADFMTPLALGTQTGGSMIRPASFCGVFAMKPTWGSVSINGVRVNCPGLDTVGWYGRDVGDLALMASLYEIPGASDLPPIDLPNLRIGLCRSPVWQRADSATQNALDEARSRLQSVGVETTSVDLPEEFSAIPEAVATMMRGDARIAFLPEYRMSTDELHTDFKADVENRRHIGPEMLSEAYDTAAACRAKFSDVFQDLDALLTPSAPGEAVLFEEGHGDPVFNVIWSALHAPVINIPGMVGPTGLPVGLSLVGPRYSDARILAISKVLSPALEAT
ncbi:MAG: amidase [Chloroflexi bacterium]|nr:amidase [Chloroflexota bacterium]|tara:strand:- start:8753 stop:10075 length:1323 start_codon:yes stop_codon:yes gene_type:complete